MILAIVMLLLAASDCWAATSWTVTPNPATFTATVNQAPFTQAFTARNTGTTTVTLSWWDTADYIKTFTPSSLSLTLAPGATGTFTAGINVQNPWNCTGGCPMVEGTYPAQASITGGGLSVTIPLTLTVQPAAPPAPPGKVSGLAFTLVTVADVVRLIWDANSEADLAGYKVYVRFPGGPYAIAGTVTQPSGTVSGLDVGKTYQFVVTAFDRSNNESGYSNEVSTIAK